MIKKIITFIFNHTGIIIGKRPTYKGKGNFTVDGLYYGYAMPLANYTPWIGDPDFMSIYQQIKNNTLVDIYRCYELWQLVNKIQSLDAEAAFLEVGVWRGGTAGIMAKRLSLLKSNATLYLADTFTGVAKAGEKDAFYKGGEHQDTSLPLVEKLLNEKCGYPSYKILKGIFPEETMQLIEENEKFGLCHIDVDVYHSAKDVMEWVWNRLITGGVVVFDDYGFHTCTGVTRLVEEYRDLPDRFVIHNLNGHAIMIKLS